MPNELRWSKQRLSTKCLWCLIMLFAGPLAVGKCVTVRSPIRTPATVEAQAKFFQDFFSVQLSPYKIEFGHVCEDPNTWEQRYEKKDFKNHRDMGKVRWGDKQGGYGEHYWDLNHAGHGNHNDDKYGSDSDDGSYHVQGNDDPYDEPTDNSPNYDNEYEPEKSSSYEESNRSKRAHSREKAEKKEEGTLEDIIPKLKPRHVRKHKEPQSAASRTIETSDEKKTTEDSYQKKPKQKRQHRPVIQKEQDFEEDYEQPREGKRVKDNAQEQQTQYVSRRQPEHYVPYEDGAGVRQHPQLEVTPAASTPRLFLEPSTGHVVDRATGQAYILQPIAPIVNYN